MKKRLIWLSALLLLTGFVLAHTADIKEAVSGASDTSINHVEDLSGRSLRIVLIAGTLLILLALFAVLKKKLTELDKKSMMFLILLIVILPTAYLEFTTVKLNIISETEGPVHWHADFEIWRCGEKIELQDPHGLNNRVGTPIFHEHGDNRIHVEGVLVKKHHVDLHSFFKVVGGELTSKKLIIPTNNGLVVLEDGQCNGYPAKLQAFAYTTEENRYSQKKLDSPEDYILSPYQSVPPGDCIIIELDREKDKTDKICASYQVAIEKGELIGS